MPHDPNRPAGADPRDFAHLYTRDELEAAAVERPFDAAPGDLRVAWYRPSFELRPRLVLIDARRLPARAAAHVVGTMGSATPPGMVDVTRINDVDRVLVSRDETARSVAPAATPSVTPPCARAPQAGSPPLAGGR